MEEVFRAVERSLGSLIPRGANVLSACSGGADSVALSAALARADVRCSIGHVDHGLRPESAQEAEHVRALAQRLGVPFLHERLEGLTTQNLEAAAREARYAALERLATQAGASIVATAHTRTDQAETILLRLIRGAGPGALAAIRRERPLGALRLVRPLLDISRADTEADCAANELPFVTDPHNADPARARAQLRAVWPALLALNPRLEEALAGAAASFATDSAAKREILREANLHGARPNRQQLERLSAALDVEGGRILVLPPEGRSQDVLAIDQPGDYHWKARRIRVEMNAPLPLRVRRHRGGDHFEHPLMVMEDLHRRLVYVAPESSEPLPAFITVRSEMDAVPSALSSKQQGDCGSANIDEPKDEEPR